MRSLNYLLKNCKKLAYQIDSQAVADLTHHVLLRTLMQLLPVNDLALSREVAPGTETTRQIAKETGISRTSVGRIIHKYI